MIQENRRHWVPLGLTLPLASIKATIGVNTIVGAFTLWRISVSWELNQHQAAYAVNDWHVDFSPSDPGAGLQVSRGGNSLGKLLSVFPQPAHSRNIQEAYVRQDDLIVRYEQDGSDLYTFQLNWRAFDCILSGSLGIELWISIQTSLLDTHPVVGVKSSSPAAIWETLTLRDLSDIDSELPAAVVARREDHTLLIMIQASDAEQVELRRCDSAQEHELQMFGHFMEKGVIRRARLCLVAAPNILDDAAVRLVYEQFTASPLPLTA